MRNFYVKKKGTFDTGHKTWDKDAWEKATNQYRTFVETQKKLETHIDYIALQQIHANLAARNITAVFVLSALNQGLINEFSEPEEAVSLITKFRNTRDDLVDFFKREKMQYIDLFDRTDSACFTDMVHLNTCGDAELAKAFADYVSHYKTRGE